MNKKVLWHILFWGGIIACDALTSLPYWDSDSGKVLIANYSIVLLLFYYTRFLTLRLLQGSPTIYQQLSFRKYLLLGGIIILFVGMRYILDYYVFVQGYAVTIWYYSFTQMKFALSFIIPAIGISFAEKRKRIISKLSEEKEKLYVQKTRLSSEKWRLLREKTVLSKEMQELKRQHEEMLALTLQQETIRTNLENEISERQNLIVVLKAELLIGAEEYKMLVEKYKDKFDYYHGKLNRYRDRYGKLDDEDE